MSGLLDPTHLLSSYGALGVFVVLFAETGLLIGFFLPGDSLLFTAGLLTATATGSAAHLSLAPVLLAGGAGALLGAEVGYLVGRRAGPALLRSEGHPRRAAGVARAAEVLERYGQGKAVVLARFIPVVRTLMNPLAGTVGVPLARFTLWQVVGGLLWSQGVVVAGSVLGARIPGLDRYLLPIIAVVVVVSLVPVAVELLRARR